jgi:carboxyl-terminal processing protease
MKLANLLVAVLVLIFSCTTGATAQSAEQDPKPPVQQPAQQEPADDGITPELLESYYHDIWERIGNHYYNPDALKDWSTWEHKYKGKLKTVEDMDKAIKEMVNSLGDRWTKYRSSDELMEGFFEHLAGVVSIGMQLERQADGSYKLRALVYGSPAHKSSLRTGDIIKSVGGKELKGLNETEAEKLLYAPLRTKTRVVYVEAGKDVAVELEFSVTPPALVEAKLLDGNIGYVRFPHFQNQVVVQRLKREVADLQKQAGGKLHGLILDLRANPGGKFEIAVELAHLLLEKGTIVSSRVRDGRITMEQVISVSPALPHVVQSQSPDERKLAAFLLKAPLVVLADGSTASASEIVIGALKDHGRARVVGTTTIGKAVGYGTVRLDDGSTLSITGLKYLTPKGSDISMKGIDPHVVVPQPRNSQDVQLEAAVKEMQKLLAPARK